ncbi:nuclear transport factor 2 family protein [Actinomadura vinacea]|uniref:Nuclear transport factor 2 family protein n=1 Tax=Actinomadura vinacea TaxID=115336 RepID=A0ABN3JLD9_9ACTN
MNVPGSFRAAVESKDLDAITATLAPDITFHSPVMVKPYQGRDAVAALLSVLLEVFEDFHYTHELAGRGPQGNGGSPPAQALVFAARVMGKPVQGLDLITFDGAGLVGDLTVMVRPLPAAMTLARAVGRRVEELGGPQADPTGDGRKPAA